MDPLRVLHSVKPPNDHTNPFVALHVENLPTTIRSSWFSWKRALWGRYDVLHFQWPENLLRASHPGKRALKRAAFGALLLRLRATRTPIVVTVHNLAPHETPSAYERALLRSLHRRSRALIALNDTEDLTRFGDAPVLVIPHGDYRQRYEPRDPAGATPGRVLFFGAIRAYKNVPALIRATLDCGSASIVVAGKPWSEEVANAIEAEALGHEDVRLRLEEVPDGDLIGEIAAAELVALPYTSLYNSGAIFLALTLNVPVLAPNTASTRQLQNEVGSDWLMLYEGSINADDIASALEQASKTRESTDVPRLGARDWAQIGEMYANAYFSAVYCR